VLNKKHNRFGAILSAVVSILAITATLWVVLNRQFVVDQLGVWQYSPTTEVASISQKSGFSKTGEFYFYASHPQVNTAAEFNTHCQRQEEKSAILGCYVDRGIYIYDVTNAQLTGIREVTAAHETLHAIWDRLSDSEKSSIGKLLESEYAKLTSPDIKERMAYYDRTEPGERLNELHSIIGTEVPTVSNELAAYYSKYFVDRSKVVAAHQAYESVFSQLETESKTLYDELTQLSNTINTQHAQYTSDVNALSADIDSFNSRAESGGFSSAAAFNSERSKLVRRSQTIELARVALNDNITLYNTKYSQYQSLAVQAQSLQQSIDSNVAPSPTL